MADLHVNSSDWTVQPSRTRATRGRTRGAADSQDGFPQEFLTSDSEVAEEFTAKPQAATRGRAIAPGPLDVSYDVGSGEAAVLTVRHPSGALTFHRPVEETGRSRGGPARVRFVVPLPSVTRPTAARGLVTQAIKAFVIKVAKKAGDKIASLALSTLVSRVEAATWKREGLQEGWLAITKDTLATDQLAAGRPSSTERTLLLIHGTFSNAASAYRGLADSNFFQRVRGLYGDRIYAFDHFTLSRTPEENARMLLDALPNKAFTFDVITHSRGGLVLRNLVERSATLGSSAKRFTLGRAVLVASPNEGTPLATPARWEGTVGWMANLLELFPVDNPFTTGAAFVANGLVWIARHASGDLPGLHAMDGDGDLIAELRRPPGPPADAYSALVANYDPDEKVLLRMIDAGVDQFFGSANDLVVPSAGGWRIDGARSSFIPADRIGCFGPGGNLPADEVTHLNFFSQPAAVDFLVTALAGKPQPLSPVDPAAPLPDRRIIRSGVLPLAGRAARLTRRMPAGKRDRVGKMARMGRTAQAPDAAPPLRLTVVNGDLTFERLPLLLGHYSANKLTGTERIMDTLIGGTMLQALQLGDYPIEPGTHQIFVNRHLAPDDQKPWLTPRPEAVIVVGLGQEGSLTGTELTHTVCQGVIAWARQVCEARNAESRPEEATRDRPASFELVATLIGSGGTGVATGQAAQLIAEGVHEANEKLRTAAKDGAWPCVGRLRIVELYLERASEAWRALHMHAEATPGRYVLDATIEPGTGSLLRPLDAGYRGAEYDFITATSRGTEIDYALDTKRARTEIRTSSPQGQLVRDLVKIASSDSTHDERIGTTLFKLLIPVDLDSFLTGGTDMLQIELDDGTAGIPWELLNDVAEKHNDKPPWAIRTKLLRKLRLKDFRQNVKDADDDGYALVIGEPETPDPYAALPGAREEALCVARSLSVRDAFGTERITSLVSTDPASFGADARTIIDTLFERDWRVVHIAGHGALPDGTGSGGVVLSNGTFLGPAEIKAMRVVPELVFINCCHLGAWSNESVLGDGRTSPSVYDRVRFASSVARGLIEIGVRCVVAAGWAVDDDAAKAFASRFYECLVEGDRFIDAVAKARSAAYAYEGNTWAAYQCYGDPDWRLRRDRSTASSEPSEHEFEGVTSVPMLKLALETLLVQKTYQGADAEGLLKRLGMLEERWTKARWGASDGVAEAFARVYAAVGDLDTAIEWYDTAADVAHGDVALHALEQRTNLQVRRAWNRVEAARGERRRRAIEEARVTIRDGLNLIAELMRLRPTAERANLCGSAKKRLALVEAAAGRPHEATRAIEEMQRFYLQGVKLVEKDGLDDLFYPASNCIAAELALHAGRRGWTLGNRALLDAMRKNLEKRKDDPDFWSVVGGIELDLYEAIETTTLVGARSTLETRYEDLHTRMRGRSDWGSVYDTASFVLAGYRQRAKPTEQRACDAVLAQLKRFVAAEPGHGGASRRRKVRR